MTSPLPIDPATPAAAATDAPGAHAITLAGERVQLLAQRALFWPDAATLFVADVHLGKAAAFRASGVPVPQGSTQADLARLTALFARTGAQRLVVLGDFLHAAAGRVASLDVAFRAWRLQHAVHTLVLIRGNHDNHAGDPPPAWGIDVVAEPYPLAPFLACHLPVEPPSGYALCGHIHPGVTLWGQGEAPARLPCFVVGPRRTILPAFGRFTGLAMIRPAAGETRVAIAGNHLFALPPG
ncbi:MAG: ligase-associated DNA damage response endonuclease PdeM [Casimicrobiaceae bacterium]